MANFSVLISTNLSSTPISASISSTVITSTIFVLQYSHARVTSIKSTKGYEVGE